jgi:hypothetical protein
VSQQKNIAQFLDRDTRPDFASTVVIPAFQSFIKKPNDIDGITKSLEEQKKSIFTIYCGIARTASVDYQSHSPQPVRDRTAEGAIDALPPAPRDANERQDRRGVMVASRCYSCCC